MKYNKELNLTSTDLEQIQTACGNVGKSVKDAASALAASKKAVKSKVATLKNSGDVLRAQIGRIKKQEGYNKDIGEDLNVVTSGDPINPDTYKTSLSEVVFPGRVTVKFTKKGVQGVNI